MIREICITLLLLGFNKATTNLGKNPYYQRNENSETQGAIVKENEFGFIVSIYTNTIHNISGKCLGIILNRYTILTAATCAFDRWGNPRLSPRSYLIKYGIRQGCHTFDAFEPIQVRKVILQKNYDMGTFAADLAFMITFEPLAVENISMIAERDVTIQGVSTKFYLSYEKIPAGISCQFFGFLMKKDTDSGDEFYQLSNAAIDVEDHLLCLEAYAREKRTIAKDKYCAGVPAKGLVPTINDTGGPLLCNGKIVAIASWTSQEGSLPGLFTDISHYSDFIKEAYRYMEKKSAIKKAIKSGNTKCTYSVLLTISSMVCIKFHIL